MRNHEPTSLIRHLQVLRAVSEAVSRSLDLDEVVQRSLAALTHVTGHEIASLHLISADGIRVFVCVPIRARHRILGTLSLGRQTEDRFTDEEVALLECVADQIGLAIDNARLYGEINRQLDDLRRAQVEVVRAERLAAVNGLAAGVAHEINNPPAP